MAGFEDGGWGLRDNIQQEKWGLQGTAATGNWILLITRVSKETDRYRLQLEQIAFGFSR